MTLEPASTITPNAAPGATFVVTGFVKADAIWTDTSDGEIADNSSGRDFYIPSTIPIGSPAADEGTDLNAHVKQSRFNFGTGTILEGGDKLMTRFEIDFFGSITGDLYLEDEVLKGAIRNDTGYPLTDVVLVMQNRFTRLGDLAPGEEKTVDLGLSSLQNDRFGPPISYRLYQENLTGAISREAGILEKAAARAAYGTADLSLLGNVEELLLLKALIQFPEEVAGAVAEYNPSRVAVHVFNTAKAFNQFYNRHPVLQSGSDALTAARLELIRATAAVLKSGLGMLGIDVLENM